MQRACPAKVVFLFLSFCGAAYAQESANLAFQGSESLQYTEKADLRIRENGRYLGHLYKEVRGYFTLEQTLPLAADGSEFEYSGVVYVLEDLKRNSLQAKWIDESHHLTVKATDRGHYWANTESAYPRTRGFPVLPGGALQQGESWREYGSQVIVPREGARPTEIRFYCEFKYRGDASYLDRSVHIIDAQYATRYRRGQDPNGDSELTEAMGKHLVTIYVEKGSSGWMFLRDQVNEVYRFADGSTREIEGFYLTWYEGALSREREEEVERLRTTLGEEGVEDVLVASTDEGISVSIQNIHFVADQAVILPDEANRLNSIAKALQTVGDGIIKVVGHTADVGLPDGQYLLSVQRAKVIIEEMVKRGLQSERFIYEGRGGTQPVGSNDTEEGRAANRRVEFIILGG